MFRTHDCDKECIHGEICNFRNEYISLFQTLWEKSYLIDGCKHKNIGDSSIVVSLECPHFIKRGADNG